MKEESLACHLMIRSAYEFQVKDHGMHCIINLSSRTCDCKEWDIFEIPCKHVALGIAHRRKSLEFYTNVSFYASEYMKAYSEIIHPILDPTFWPADLDPDPATLLPLKIKKLPIPL